MSINKKKAILVTEITTVLKYLHKKNDLYADGYGTNGYAEDPCQSSGAMTDAVIKFAPTLNAILLSDDVLDGQKSTEYARKLAKNLFYTMWKLYVKKHNVTYDDNVTETTRHSMRRLMDSVHVDTIEDEELDEANFPYDVDHMPGATRKDLSPKGCTTCHGRRFVYKLPDGDPFDYTRADNPGKGAKRIVCPTCKGK